jgi:predicted DNA-binding transcriptional regulator AlpA
MDINPNLGTQGYIRLKELLKLIPVSKSTLYAGIKSGAYPAPVRIGARISAWRVSDIRELLTKISEQQ